MFSTITSQGPSIEALTLSPGWSLAAPIPGDVYTTLMSFSILVYNDGYKCLTSFPIKWKSSYCSSSSVGGNIAVMSTYANILFKPSTESSVAVEITNLFGNKSTTGKFASH